MPTLTPQSTGAETAAAIAPDPPAQARQSPQRRRRLTEYIQAHTGEDIEVVLTPHVQTACVLPADADSLIDADATNFDPQAARQLVDAVDGDYLVLISTTPANLEYLPLNDQLTADRGQQFGLSLHELGHIRYTNISVVSAHLDERVDDEYQAFVHGLINYAEDAAIEHQLREAQSQLAADRLELVNRSLTQQADDLSPHDQVPLTYRDAIQSYLYDHGIYDSGKSDVLLDPADPRITFQSPDDATAFAQTQDALADLLATVLSEPDSVTRGDAVLDCWEQTIKPLLTPIEADDQQGQEGENAAATGGGSPDSPPAPSPSPSSPADESDQGEPSNPSTDPDAGEETPAAPSDDAPSGDGAADSVDSAPSDAMESRAGSSRETPENASDGQQGESPAAGESSEAPGEETTSEPPPDFDPKNVSLEPTQDAHSADVLAYPDIGTAENADELAPAVAQSSDVTGDASQSESDVEPNAQPETRDTSSGDIESGESADESASGDDDTEGVDSVSEGGAGESAGDESSSTPGDIGESTAGEGSASDPDGETAPGEDCIENRDNGEEAGDDASSSGMDGEPSRPSNGQASFSSFLGDDSASNDSGGDASDGDAASSDGADVSDPPDSPGGDADDTGAPDGRADDIQSGADGEGRNPSRDAADADTAATQSESTDAPANTQEPTEEDALDTSGSDDPSGDEQTAGDEEASEKSERPRAQPVEPAYDDTLDDREGALNVDHDAAHEEALSATPDQDALARDLDETAAALEDLTDDSDTTENDHSTASRGRGGQGAGKGSLDSLTVLPQVGEQAPPARWQAATAGADAVGGTLRMALRESRRDQVRSGVTSGSFDRRRVGALARGDVNVFSVRQQGEEKQYDLVLVLDRSRSMRHLIDTAEDAIVRFALACEDLGINVAIMDFVHSNARLVKPFSVEPHHVQASLMSGETGGGTPLSDALGLARRLLEQRRDSPLVIIVTDGKPSSTDDYQQELQQCFAPVCGLTLALDTPRGDVPARAADVERFYDRHLYVHDASQLEARLDQFAVMFDGL